MTSARASNHLPWTTKYAPALPAEMPAQRAALEELRNFVRVHRPGMMAMLYGAQGTGKTTMVHALARELDAELLEVNASDVRNEAAINEILGAALKQRSLFAQTKIILFDEADGLSGMKDRGGLGAIMKLANDTTFPIILTANNPWDGKFSDLRKRCVMINARALAYTSIVPVLRKIADAESLTYTDEALQMIARRAGGDIRAAITDLQSIAPDITAARIETLDQRDTAGKIIDAVRIVLKTKDPKVAREALDGLQEDIDEIFLWMDENLPKEYRTPEDVKRGYEMISQADKFRGRIRKWQHWRFLVYCYDLLGPGIALAKHERYDGFSEIKPTQRIFAMWRSKSAKRDSVVEKLGKEQHISKKVARQEMRILRRVLSDADFLSDDEQEWLAESTAK